MTSLYHRSYLTLAEYQPDEIHYLLNLARQLKQAKYTGAETPRLTGKQIALIFEKPSTRTRCAFEVAAHDQGAHVTAIDPADSQIGHKESIKDTARVLGRMFDAIEYRGYRQATVEALAKYAGVPVYNGLTDEFHPTQMLADVMTMIEASGKPPAEISFCYLGDARNNIGDSLMIIGAKLGMEVRLCAPRPLWPNEALTAQCRLIAAATGARLIRSDAPHEAVKGVDFIYTDVWVSMGESPEHWRERIDLLLPFQVNAELIAASGNREVKCLHCLPALHDTHTQLGKEIADRYGLTDGVEITDQVFEANAATIFAQAENRLHTIKAILVATLASPTASR